jgi:hypothetical protein
MPGPETPHLYSVEECAECPFIYNKQDEYYCIHPATYLMTNSPQIPVMDIRGRHPSCPGTAIKVVFT